MNEWSGQGQHIFVGSNRETDRQTYNSFHHVEGESTGNVRQFVRMILREDFQRCLCVKGRTNSVCWSLSLWCYATNTRDDEPTCAAWTLTSEAALRVPALPPSSLALK